MRTSCQAIPTYYVRYEDLVLDPLPTVTNIMRFMLDTPSIEGTICEQMVAKACEQGIRGKQTYAFK